MEQSPRSLILQRLFAALLLAGVAAAAWRQARSPLAQSLREKPALGRLARLDPGGQRSAAALPGRSSARAQHLDSLLHPGADQALRPRHPRSTYEAAYKKNPRRPCGRPGDGRRRHPLAPNARCRIRLGPACPCSTKKPPRIRRLAPAPARQVPPPGPEALAPPRGLSRFDALLLALELRRLPAKAVHAAFLAPEAAAAALLETALSPRRRGAPGPEERDLAVEVLNATQKIGIATQAKKVLRWKGADVVATGNAEAPRERTLIYDRLGRIENADAVRRMLDCPSAETLTAVDSGRAVDVTVVLAEDCPLR